MLNRRFLRIKVMQSAFSFTVAQQAQKEVILDEIGEHFAPDLNSMEPQDREQLTINKTLTQELFKDSVEDTVLIRSESEAVDQEAALKIKEFLTFLNTNRIDIKKGIQKDLNSLHRSYLTLLHLTTLFKNHIEWRENKERKMKISTMGFAKSEYNITKNRLIAALATSETLSFTLQAKNAIPLEDTVIKEVYATCLKTEQYSDYLKLEEPTLEEDISVFRKIIRIFLKHESIKDAIGDLHWEENKEIIKGIATSLTKNFTDVIAPSYLQEIIKEEDQKFWVELFDLSVEKDEDLHKLITDNLKNWDMDRVTVTDQILLKMALQEMIHFTSIPTKVTINEYIEISKQYSTPKSKQFVNGILDTLSKELTDSGKIKKSGRGLI